MVEEQLAFSFDVMEAFSRGMDKIIQAFERPVKLNLDAPMNMIYRQLELPFFQEETNDSK